MPRPAISAAFASVVAARDAESVYFKVDEKGFIPSSTWSQRIMTEKQLTTLPQSAVTVDIPGLGQVAGDIAGGAEFFLGMPYAQPPLGKLRFMPAQSIGPWTGTINATQFCPSPMSAFADPRSRQPVIDNDAQVYKSEDILCVNVWRPAGTTATSKKPVMVWIYGGGMVSGSSTNPWYDGKNLAQYHDRVVVSLNYRVGPLGFFASQELASNGAGNGGANGLLDQNLALKWVKQNVGAFGGDTESIGIFGESAGSLSVCTHLVSPLSAGLFNYAVLESGDCSGPWGPGDESDGLALGQAWMKHLGCDSVACLQDRDLLDVIHWPSTINNNHSFESSWKLENWAYQFPGYWVDSYYLPKQPYELLRTGPINAKAVLLGTNSMDGFVAYEYESGSLPTYTNYAAGMATMWNPYDRYPDVPAKVAAQYAANNTKVANVDDTWWQYTLADRDYNLYCASYYLAELLQSQGVPAYRYKFSIGPRLYDQACIAGMVPCCQKDDVACYGWASHGSEIPFAFNTTGNACDPGDACSQLTDPFTGAQSTVVKAMNEYWTSFLENGVPTSEGFPNWQTADKGLVVFDTPSPSWTEETVDCAFWSQWYPASSSITSV